MFGLSNQNPFSQPSNNSFGGFNTNTFNTTNPFGNSSGFQNSNNNPFSSQTFNNSNTMFNTNQQSSFNQQNSSFNVGGGTGFFGNTNTGFQNSQPFGNSLTSNNNFNFINNSGQSGMNLSPGTNSFSSFNSNLNPGIFNNSGGSSTFPNALDPNKMRIHGTLIPWELSYTNPQQGSNQSVKFCLMSLTSSKTYNHKSLFELRLEDWYFIRLIFLIYITFFFFILKGTLAVSVKIWDHKYLVR
jgi:hypothetical protein